MKKLFALILVIILSSPACFAWGWFGKKDNSTPAPEAPYGSGYKGKLPDLTKNQRTSEPTKAKPIYENSKDFNSAEEIRPVPRENPAFVNIILKEDKTSPYLNDLNDVLPQLENLLLCIENSDTVQLFNAKAYFFNKTVEYLKTKYQGKPEYSFLSFQKLMELSSHTQTVANLRAEAEKYRPYMAYTGAGHLYNDDVINEQLEFLKIEIEDTIVVLKEAI